MVVFGEALVSGRAVFWNWVVVESRMVVVEKRVVYLEISRLVLTSSSQGVQCNRHLAIVDVQFYFVGRVDKQFS